MYGDTEECGDVSPNITDHETTTTAAAIPAVKNNIPPPVCDQETAEQASRAILQENSRARSGEGNEQASSSTEQEFNEVSAEDLWAICSAGSGAMKEHTSRGWTVGSTTKEYDRAGVPTTPTKGSQRQRLPEKKPRATPAYRPEAPKE
jgi:hypothetical protein